MHTDTTRMFAGRRLVSALALAAALGATPATRTIADDADFKREQDLSAKEGQPAPALEVKDWMNTPDGQPLKLEDLKGKVVVIDFWGTW